MQDNESIKKLVNIGRQDLMHEVCELKDAMARLLEEKKKLTDDLFEEESYRDQKYENKVKNLLKNKDHDFNTEKQELNEKLMNSQREINIVQTERNKFLEELSNKERLISDLEKQLSYNMDHLQMIKESENLNKMKINELLKEIEQLRHKIKYCEDEFKQQAINCHNDMIELRNDHDSERNETKISHNLLIKQIE